MKNKIIIGQLAFICHRNLLSLLQEEEEKEENKKEMKPHQLVQALLEIELLYKLVERVPHLTKFPQRAIGYASNPFQFSKCKDFSNL